MKYLIERSSAITPKEEFEKLLKSKKNLRIKLGVDPTAPDVTLGWYAILRMLRKFQDYGHTAILILGEFTAQVGDPSGKSETRIKLQEDDVNKNSDGVLPLIKNILNHENLEIVSNRDWLSKISTAEMVNLASSTTLAQMLERDDFSKRYENGNPISLMEFFYPLFQGYDSVAVKADIEIGGHDQLWNLMLGREIQKFYNLSPQIAITFPLLVGTDGTKKMSQSLGNYISISDTPENIYGKLMSIPDEAMWEYFMLLTDIEIDEINKMKSQNDVNPFEYKKKLGHLIVTELYSKKDADHAEDSFNSITINKATPSKVDEYKLERLENIHLPKVLTDFKLTKSNSEARRLIESGSLKIDNQKFADFDINFDDFINKTIQLGKRNYFTILEK